MSCNFKFMLNGPGECLRSPVTGHREGEHRAGHPGLWMVVWLEAAAGTTAAVPGAGPLPTLSASSDSAFKCWLWLQTLQ